MKQLVILSLFLSSLLLGACVSKTNPLSVQVGPTTTPPVIESNGEPEKDAQAIEEELNTLNSAQDFASFTEQDLIQ